MMHLPGLLKGVIDLGHLVWEQWIQVKSWNTCRWKLRERRIQLRPWWYQTPRLKSALLKRRIGLNKREQPLLCEMTAFGSKLGVMEEQGLLPEWVSLLNNRGLGLGFLHLDLQYHGLLPYRSDGRVLHIGLGLESWNFCISQVCKEDNWQG